MAIFGIKGFIVFVFLCACYGERRFNNCVTWRDDLRTLIITCRVANFSQLVTISHDKSRTEIHCSISKEKPTCYPPEKNIITNKNNHTVSIQLFEPKTKNGEQLQGRWQCTQGGNKLITEVSFSDGIKSDSWVNIRGKLMVNRDGGNDIIVECSSCRKPEDNYVEYFVNSESYGSILHNEISGVCRYKRQKCIPDKCNCSSTGNMVQLRLQLTDDMKEIACEMQFYDGLRKGQFGITSSMKIIGEGVLYDDSITRVIVENNYKPILGNQNKTVDSNDTVIPDLISDDIEVSNAVESRMSTSLIIVIVAVPLLLIMLVIVIFILLFRYHKRKQHNGAKGINVEEEVPLVEENGNNGMHCDSCKRTNKRESSEEFCLNCGEKLCRPCIVEHVKSKLTQSHRIFHLEIVPQNLSFSLFCPKHETNELSLFCKSHDEIICVKCIRDEECKVEDIDHRCQKPVNLDPMKYKVRKTKRDIETILDKMVLTSASFQENEEKVHSKIQKLQSHGSTSQIYAIQKELKAQVKHIAKKFTDTNNEHSKAIADSRTKLEIEEKNIEFFQTHVDSQKLAFVYSNQSMNRINNAIQTIENINSSVPREHLDLKWTFEDPLLGKIDTGESEIVSPEVSELTAASQTPTINYSFRELEMKLELHCSHLFAVNDDTIAYFSKHDENHILLVCNVLDKTKRHHEIELKNPPHDIAAIPNAKRVMITSKTVDELLEVNLETNAPTFKAVDSSANASLAVNSNFIFLGLGSKRMISILRHNGIRVLNIHTQSDVDRLCCYDDRIFYSSSKSRSVRSIDLYGEEIFENKIDAEPTDILATSHGQLIMLEDSSRGLRKFSKDGQELYMTIKKQRSDEKPIAICCNNDASKIYILSSGCSGIVLNELCEDKDQLPLSHNRAQAFGYATEPCLSDHDFKH